MKYGVGCERQNLLENDNARVLVYSIRKHLKFQIIRMNHYKIRVQCCLGTRQAASSEVVELGLL